MLYWPEPQSHEWHFLSLKLSTLCYALMNSIVPYTNQVLPLLEQLTPLTRDRVKQEPIARSLQLPHIPVTAFSQTDLFLVWIYLEFRSHGNLSNQLQSQARTNVDMSKWRRHVHVWPHCFILTEACSCRLELAYFAGKISKNRLVCKNAVALAYYGSCLLLVMGSWWSCYSLPIFSAPSSPRFLPHLSYPRAFFTLPSFARIKRPRWRLVGLNDPHLRFHGKIGDCEQSI